jgi:putative membrane protein
VKRPAWQQEGQEPDYRFSLANERTFLAWIRTGLALLAAGILLDQFAARIGPHAIVVSVAAGLGWTAALLCGLAHARWKANERAMRHGMPLPASRIVPLLAIVLLLAGAVLGALILLRPVL